ncbi:uncharacterized protein LOC131648340 [Vicia villosa]|uniref:uncharacterized protein LOC131648340 n=1 Tax=Vicia villosa TaxID=3911 RepID=UPI00273C9A4E|nr:uncharacterized protein LOC131648340 [Vicia villosa]
MTCFSQGLVFTTAMVVSTTMLYLVFSKQKNNPSFQIQGNHVLRSCLYSEEKKKERKMNTKKSKKKVRFAESVKEEREKKSEVVRKEKQRKRNRVYSSNCRSETSKSRGIPANRIALFNGILRDRVHRMECC